MTEVEGKVTKRGLASASEETRKRVAKSGGKAFHAKRGLAAASPEVRRRVAKIGGDARGQDREGMAEAGRIGGNIVKERYGMKFYSAIGTKGGGTVMKRYGKDFYSQIGKVGGSTLKEERGPEYYSMIGKKAKGIKKKPDIDAKQGDGSG